MGNAMNEETQYRASLESIAALRDLHPTRDDIETADDYIERLCLIERWLRRYPLAMDIDAAERCLGIVKQLERLSGHVPSDEQMDRLERHVANLRRVADSAGAGGSR